MKDNKIKPLGLDGKFSTQSGLGLIQGMILGAAVAAIGAYVLKNQQTQQGIQNFSATHAHQSAAHQELSTLLTSEVVCTNTLGPLTMSGKSVPVPGILNESGSPLYEISGGSLPSGPGMKNTQAIKEHSPPKKTEMPVSQNKIDGLKITRITFDLPSDYSANPNFHLQRGDLTLRVEKLGATNQQGFGGQDRLIKVPIMALMYQNRIFSCVSAGIIDVEKGLQVICEALQGNFDEVTGSCNDLQGPNSYVNRMVRDHFCSTSPNSCNSHPLAGSICASPPAPDGVNYDNHVIKSFRANGSPECTCVPVKRCPDPTLYCSGTNLGSDGCVACPSGTKTDGACDCTVCGSPP